MPTRTAVLAKTFVVVSAFDAYRLLVTDSVTRFETCHTFRVPTFAVVAKTFVVVTAFETNTFPTTWRLAVVFVVPIPILPCEYIDVEVDGIT